MARRIRDDLLTAGRTGKFLAKVIAELFSRVALYAFPPANFAFDYLVIESFLS